MPKIEIPRQAEGTSSSVNVANRANKSSADISLLLDSHFLYPLVRSGSAFDQLEALFHSMKDLAAGTEPRNIGNATLALARLRHLADIGAFVAADFSNFLDSMHEDGREQHLPAILAAVGCAQ